MPSLLCAARGVRTVTATVPPQKSRTGHADAPNQRRRSVLTRVSRREGLLSSTALFGAARLLQPQHAWAFGRDYPLENISYEVGNCAKGTYLPKPTGYSCLTVRGTAKVTGKDIEAADVFGFVTDARNISALAVNPDGNTRTVIAGINKPMKGGGAVQDVEFTLVVTDAALANLPLTFKGFKLNPSMASIEDHFLPLTACELDPTAEECIE